MLSLRGLKDSATSTMKSMSTRRGSTQKSAASGGRYDGTESHYHTDSTDDEQDPEVSLQQETKRQQQPWAGAGGRRMRSKTIGASNFPVISESETPASPFRNPEGWRSDIGIVPPVPGTAAAVRSARPRRLSSPPPRSQFVSSRYSPSASQNSLNRNPESIYDTQPTTPLDTNYFEDYNNAGERRAPSKLQSFIQKGKKFSLLAGH